MIDQIVFTASSDRIAEGSRLNIDAQFRDSTTRLPASPIPVTVEWALQCPDDGRMIQEFIAATPGASVTIATTGTQNTMRGCSSPSAQPSERRVLTVLADRGLGTQFLSTYCYTVTNVGSYRI